MILRLVRPRRKLAARQHRSNRCCPSCLGVSSCGQWVGSRGSQGRHKGAVSPGSAPAYYLIKHSARALAGARAARWCADQPGQREVEGMGGQFWYERPQHFSMS